MRDRRKLGGWLVCCAAVALSVGASSPRAEVADLLDRPAAPSPRALRLVQLAVARAGSRLVSVGERGTVLLSDDNGKSWRQAKVPVSVSLTGVWFATDRLGWAVGHSGVVLHTTDGGETWAKQLDGKQAAQVVLAEVKATAGSDAASQQRLREAERLVADGPDKPFLDVRFADEKNGFIVGAYGLIFSTADGGKTWRFLGGRTDNPKSKHLYAVRPAGPAGSAQSDWYVAGEQGLLLRSTDGGKSFAQVKTPYVGTYFGVVPGTGRDLLLFGLRGNAYWSGDAGAHWQKVDTGIPATLAAGTKLADGSVVLVDESGRVLRSGDGGKSFTPVPVPQPAPLSGVVQAADGGLIVTGVRGVQRLALATSGTKSGEAKP